MAMNGILAQLAQTLGTGWLHDHVVSWLRNVPGLPPIVQAVHILSIACVMASIVMIDLRVLGWAAPSQSPAEMMRRLMPWLWTALCVLFLSGAMFVIARPRRYFVNPIFGFKFAFLVTAILLAVVLQRMQRKSSTPTVAMKLVGALSLLAWLGVVLAGRWIAYADYLIAPE
jgi:uncharacterized membrane protein SirB2